MAMDPHEEDRALARDAADPVPTLRGEFHVPPGAGRFHEVAYFAGNSLGLQPRAARDAVLTELDDWARLGVEGHREATHPWLPYHEELRGPAARLVGARPEETVVMNSLTVNLHLMMASFYRPAGPRRRILIEDNAFPSDSYAVRSQAAFHGLDPDQDVVRVPADSIVDYLAGRGERVALVLLGGVNYLTGEVLDIPGVTAAGHAAGCLVGWDLAHAVGNIPLRLHDWGADFAVWCSYKYLNAGPGAVAGCFVHSRHLGRGAKAGGGATADPALPRLSGWWGTDPATRFLMRPVAEPPPTVDAWQVSNPPILAMAPVRVSLDMFDQVGMAALRGKSGRLTGYLASLLDGVRPLRVITPADPARRGCQLSVRVGEAGKLARALREEDGVIADVREPDTIRLAPAPLYSTFHDCWRAAAALSRRLS